MNVSEQSNKNSFINQSQKLKPNTNEMQGNWKKKYIMFYCLLNPSLAYLTAAQL